MIVRGRRLYPESPSAEGAGSATPDDIGGLGMHVEEVLRQQVKAILGAEPLSLEAPLTGLGLDSLSAIELQAAVERELGVSPSLDDLLSGADLRQLASALRQQLAESTTPPRRALSRQPRAPLGTDGEAPTVDLPLSWGQRGLWFLEIANPGNAAYHVAIAARSRRRIDASALRRALAELARRHPELRVTFHATERGPVQRPATSRDLEILASNAKDAGDGELRARMREILALPFDLERGPLVRAALLDRGPDSDVLLLAAHHLVTDLWSAALLLRELGALYGSYAAAGEPAPPEPDQPAIAEYVEWQREYLDGPRAEEDWEYWRERLAPTREVVDLPCDRPRPAVRSGQGRSMTVALPTDVASQLHGIGRQSRVGFSAVLLAVFQALLHRLTHADDLLVGLPVAGPRGGRFSGLVGYLVNPVVVRTRLGGDPAFEELVGRVRDGVLGALHHASYPFPLLVERLALDRDPSRTPLFDVLFTLQQAPRFAAPALAAVAAGAEGVRLDLGSLELETIGIEEAGAAFDLALAWGELGGVLHGRLTYADDLFDAVSMQRLTSWLATLAAAVAAAPGRSLSDLPLLAAAEVHQLQIEWSAGEPLERGEERLHDLFESWAEGAPHAVALVWRGEETTYADLDAQADQLAARLRLLGVGPESRVGVLLPRTPALVASLLAVLKAGGAYVGLDPSYPPERLAYLLGDAGVRVLVTRPGMAEPLLGELLTSCRVDIVDPLDPDIALGAPERPAGGAIAGNLAYLIYTSGSTGRPKGVAIEHRSAVARVRWARAAFDAGELAGVVASTSVCFDLSVFEIFVPLACGGTVILVDDVLALVDQVEESWTLRARLLNTVPSAMYALLAAGWSPSGLRTVNLAGEPLTSSLAGAIHRRLGIERLLNLYGPSEDTTYSTLASIDRWETASPSIGRPLAGGRALVLDPRGRPSPAGVVGELYLGGTGLARGYLDRADQTAERFVPDPSGDRPGERLFRTGDLVRLRHDGGLEFVGRRDHQVKVRGFRIELEEVGAAVAGLPGVREAAAAAPPDVSGGRVLVAYVVPEAQGGSLAGAVAAMRRELGKRLPAYMIPTVFVELPELPRTPNGKLDRQALPDPRRAGLREDRQASEPLRTPIEELLVGIWCDLLGRRSIALDDDFFALGGHSLLAVRAVARLRDLLGIEVPVTQLFTTSTVAALAAWIEAGRRAGAELPAVEPVPRTGRLPLSYAQERLWFLDRLEPGGCLYNMPIALTLRGPLDSAALARGLQLVAERHEVLRTVFLIEEGEPTQRISPRPAMNLWVVDLSQLPEARARRIAANLSRREARRPFDLALGPLLRTGILRESPERHTLLLTLHHAVGDGGSLSLLMRELGALYRPSESPAADVLPDLTVQYADFALWQRRRARDGALDREIDFWRRQLRGVPKLLDLATDRPRPARRSSAGRQAAIALSGDEADLLAQRAREAGLTSAMLFLAASQILLARTAGEEDLALGVPVAGRDRVELEPLIGCFVNLLAVRCGASPEQRVADLLRRTREILLEALDHRALPFERLIEELQPARDLGRVPLVQVLVAHQSPGERPRFHGLDAEAAAVETGTAKFDLTIETRQGREGLALRLEGSADLWDGTTLARRAGQLRALLAALAGATGERVADLSLLAPAERHQIEREWNAGEAVSGDAGRGACLHDLFAAQAARTPDALALLAEGERWTYRELAVFAAEMADRLRRLGVGAEDRVALCVERSPAMVGALLGILAAGGGYVPLDPRYPAERLAFMLADSAARVLVIDGAPAAGLEEFAGTLLPLKAPGGRVASAVPAAVAAPVSPGQLAYVIYTSGSTGRPKGVAIEHRSASELVRWAGETFAPEELRGVLASTSICFDLSVFEIFVPLCSGGCAVLTAGSALDLPRHPGASAVTLINTVPSAMAALAEGPLPTGLRTVCLAGESLSPALVARIEERAPAVRVLNLYGPTEDTTYSTWTTVGQGRRLSIGRPLPGTDTYVLDFDRQPVPIGTCGEIHLAGAGLARGYLGRPELTAERFLPDPSGAVPGRRLYRTGDLGRRLTDGSLDFLGRADRQVKVRGFRIELEEVESALLSHPAVSEAVVVARETADRVGTLAAYVVAGEGASDLRAFLRRRLPEFMVPSMVIGMAQIPRLPNGKADRRALLSLAPGVPPRPAEPVEPRTATERMLTGIWGALLASERLGIHDDFFELGGHSLMLTRLAASYRDAFAVDLPLHQLFEARTIAELGRLVDERQSGRSSAGHARIRRASREPRRVRLAADGRSPDPESLDLMLEEREL